ncbi:glyoxalase/bleomycin resistance/extradiol dioxygenase family protein [Paracoccus aurantiacus]|uniref:Glyoxalase/bleomycin resistance/extradiol dioxygenase family protein n=2 Tax=Paracoccus aurantiacus TaxID=2599412 RepID=A0A5C6S222_9RHOB|nr:VOC family protein [Paracoccus aurantiacus]TXB68275.1 glyoxalase/bleomycin resistance/extradiol dioxygenase family protein [Paracoccus aurantiacus]
MPPLLGVLEAALYADDLEAARRFYADVVGLEVMTAREGRHVFFRCEKTVVLVFRAEATREPPPPDTALPVPPHGAEGAGHLCFSVPMAALDDWVERLQGSGVAIESDFIWPNGARSVYVRDPAGNSVEFASPKLWEMPE